MSLEVPELGAWTRRAACTSADPEVFYPARSDTGNALAAKAICATCPVVDECLQWALDHDEIYGVWGGLSEHERRELRGS